LIDPKRRRGEGRSRTARPRHAPGRWSLLGLGTGSHRSAAEHIEAFARQLLDRWGVLFRDAAYREPLAPAWRDLLGVLRRMEAGGEIRGGRFVESFIGEQFARPEALDLMRAVRRERRAAEDRPAALSLQIPASENAAMSSPAMANPQ
jgi:ATP-dependent Lhr-like helicase